MSEQQAGTELNFGILFPNEDYGLVQSYERTDEIQRALSKGPDGSATSIQEYQDQAKLRLTYLVISSSTATEPEIGTAFDYDGLTWNLDTIEDANSVDGFEAKTIEATWYPKIR